MTGNQDSNDTLERTWSQEIIQFHPHVMGRDVRPGEEKGPHAHWVLMSSKKLLRKQLFSS